MKSSEQERVVLVGFSGSGKSSLGKLLASRLKWEALDVDECIEREAGKSITEIIRVEGEPAFRAKEKQALRQALQSKNAVIAIGGGALLDAENKEMVLNQARVVSLQISAEEAAKRVRADEQSSAQPKRPLLAGKDSDLLLQVSEMMRARAGIYDIGELSVSVNYLGVKELCAILERELLRPVACNKGPQAMSARSIIPMANSQIVIGSGVRAELGTRLRELFPKSQAVACVVDSAVWEKWEKSLRESLQGYSGKQEFIPIRGGEQSKRLATVEEIGSQMLAAGLTRGDVVVGIGGGVIGDLTGLVASLFMRGVGLVHMPTTVVAQVDSAIGGKTGVNLAGGKNLLGTFREAELILTDLDFLSTLPEREYVAGLSEVIKYGLIDSADFFEWIEQNIQKISARDAAALRKVVEVSSQTKVRFVRGDLLDRTGLRAQLNFGHTVGHALEQISAYGAFLHGEAVAIGMVKALEVGEQIGNTPKDIRPRVVQTLQSFGLPVAVPVELKPHGQGELRERWRKALAADKKRVARHLEYVLLDQVGHAMLADVEVDSVVELLCR